MAASSSAAALRPLNLHNATATVKESRQLTTDEHWLWGRDTSLMQHWHGRWRTWHPLESPAAVRSVKSVRSLKFAAPDKSRFVHKNDWYDREGAPSPLTSAGTEWEVVQELHSLPDGMLHPANSSSRRYCVNEQGEGVWAALGAEGPEGMLLLELFFRKGPDTRLGSVLGFLPSGAFMASLVAEEARETADRPAPSAWSPAFSAIPEDLPGSLPELPSTGPAGTRSTLTRHLLFTEEDDVPFPSSFFLPGIPASDHGSYSLTALPEQLVLCAPTSLAAVWGRPFALGGTWLLGEGQVKRIAVFYGPDGQLTHTVGERFGC